MGNFSSLLNSHCNGLPRFERTLLLSSEAMTVQSVGIRCSNLLWTESKVFESGQDFLTPDSNSIDNTSYLFL
jgi:hypothetical protein